MVKKRSRPTRTNDTNASDNSKGEKTIKPERSTHDAFIHRIRVATASRAHNAPGPTNATADSDEEKTIKPHSSTQDSIRHRTRAATAHSVENPPRPSIQLVVGTSSRSRRRQRRLGNKDVKPAETNTSASNQRGTSSDLEDGTSQRQARSPKKQRTNTFNHQNEDNDDDIMLDLPVYLGDELHNQNLIEDFSPHHFLPPSVEHHQKPRRMFPVQDLSSPSHSEIFRQNLEGRESALVRWWDQDSKDDPVRWIYREFSKDVL
ncbi:hypothetical protein FPQ18DRAFT_307873 [Pyronema domesticum]|nr:hypothetical protein FPQ18DRAFT_307873 [Pyronema domesticum]